VLALLTALTRLLTQPRYLGIVALVQRQHPQSNQWVGALPWRRLEPKAVVQLDTLLKQGPHLFQPS
jgi:hypothetical protein